MTPAEARERTLEILLRAETACVTTLDPKGRPQTRAMFNLRNRDQFPGLPGFFEKHGERFTLYFTTNTSSSKVAELRLNPAASVYYCLPAEFKGVMLGGDLEVVEERQTIDEIWQPGWTLYYPGGPHDPDHTLLRLIPSEGKLYHQLQSARLF